MHGFADTAALIENLDLVISVDTAIVHLADTPWQTGLALESFRHLPALAAKSRRYPLVPVAAPVSPTYPRGLAERDQPRAGRLAASR
jgi:hypothetical protein